MKTDRQFCVNQFRSLILPIILSVLGSRPPCLRCEGERGEGAVVCCCCCCGRYKTGPGTPELISFTGPRVMRAGTAAKIAAATWLGKHDFMWEDDKMSIEYALQLATLRLLKVLALAKMLNWIYMKTVCFISDLETLYYQLTTLTFSILNMIITPPLQSEIRTHFSYVTSGKNQTRTYSYFILSQRFAWCQLRPRGDLGEAGAEARRAGEAARRPGLLEATLLLSPSTEEPVMLCSSSSSLRSIIYYPWLMSRWCRPGCVRRGGWPPGRAVRLHPRSPRRGLPHIRWGPRDCLLMRGSGRWRWEWNTLAGSFVTQWRDKTRTIGFTSLHASLQPQIDVHSREMSFVI